MPTEQRCCEDKHNTNEKKKPKKYYLSHYINEVTTVQYFIQHAVLHPAMSMRHTLTIYSEDLIVSKKHILQSNCTINSDWQPSEDFFLPVKSSLIIIIKF